MATPPTHLDSYFGPPTIISDGVEHPKRSVVEFLGAEVEDDETNKRTIVKITALGGDADGVAHITANEMVADGDATTEIRSKLDHITTADDTPVAVTLFTLADPEVRRLDLIVTATNPDASIGATFTLRARLRRSGGGAVLVSGGTDATPDRDDAGVDAAIVVSGNDAQLQVTGLAAEDTTFGYEVRSQAQVIEA